MSDRFTDAVEKAIRKLYTEKMSERIDFLQRCAYWDVNFGPHKAEDYEEENPGHTWPGYFSACEELTSWAEDNITEIWYDYCSDDFFLSEPEGYEDEESGDYIEPAWDDVFHFERRDVMRIVFGDLIGNGM